MAEVLVEFTDPVISPQGQAYTARACGAEMSDHMWQGWIEFVPRDGAGEPVRSGRETTQPNRTDAVYWATGLTAVYLEGALHRALHPLTRVPPREIDGPSFDGPAATLGDPNVESILNPFSAYRKGEALLRKQLSALSAWHLVNIIRAHRLSNLDEAVLNQTSRPVLIDLIVNGVKSFEAGAAK